MPASVELTENGHVLHYVFTDPWTLEDMVVVTRQGKLHYDQSAHKIHVLLDVTQARRVPPCVLTARSNPDLTHSNSGHIVIVGASGVVKAMGDLIVKVIGTKKVSFHEDETEAWASLRAIIAEEVNA